MSPKLFAAIDDHSRLLCHAQWYWSESARTYTHGLCQAFLKHGLPRAIMSDRGSAELAKEVRAGLSELGILLCPTEAYSPYQNANYAASVTMPHRRPNSLQARAIARNLSA